MRSIRLVSIALAAAVLTAVPPAPALASATSASASARAGRVLAVGSRGGAVRALQVRLGLPADGIFGRRTARAVKRFQRRRKLPVTGRVDAATRTALGLDQPAGGAPPSTGGTASPDDVVTMVDAVRSALGRRYRAGASGPDEFDCSGLTAWAAQVAGLELPRSSFAQYQVGEAVAREAIVSGDLVFFDSAGPGASDVAIATSATTVISATTHGVREHPIFGAYWGEHYVGARRIAQDG